jgi:prepilin-type N-terminal cleavage/methylation domain-containing protein
MSMYMMQHRSIKPSGGFTLIELMVSLTVFAIVMVVSTSTLLTMVNANAKAQALYSATSNLSFALDSMTREIRTGFHYYCTNAIENDIAADTSTRNCDTTAGQYIAFTRERDDGRMAYRLSGGKIQQNVGPGWQDITAEDVVIDVFTLTVKNTDSNTTNLPMNTEIYQPTVDLFIKGHVNNGLDTDTDFHIQTHIVQRRLDLL